MIEEALITNQLISKDGYSPVRIVIQGYRGAFHEIAARAYQEEGDVEIVPADTFEELVEIASDAARSDGGIMAIENSIAGGLIYNYELLNQSELTIIGEVYIRIKQNLMVHKGQRIEDLTEVYSHPMAIAQSRQFFRQYPHIKLISAIDTALSAKMIRDKNMMNAGAIAGGLAAELYDLEIIGESIETNKQNFTRFLILAPKAKVIEQNNTFNKVSLSFSLKHKVGSLYQVMAALAACRANLTKIQSVPIVGKPWEYRFFVDYVLTDPEDYTCTLNGIKPLVNDLNILGTYQKGIHYED